MILSLRWKDFFHRSHHEVNLSLLLKCLWCQEELLHLCFTGVCVCVLGGFWLPLRSSNKCNSIHSGVSVCVEVFLHTRVSIRDSPKRTEAVWRNFAALQKSLKIEVFLKFVTYCTDIVMTPLLLRSADKRRCKLPAREPNKDIRLE